MVRSDRAVLAKVSGGECGGQGEIYRYKTIDSRVKNIAPTRDQISDTERYKFRDGSDLEIFYQELIQELSGTATNIKETTQIFSGTSSSDMTGVISNLNNIKQAIISGNNGLQSILNYPTANLLTLNTTQAAALANQRNANNLTSAQVQVLNQRIANTAIGIQELLAYLEGLSIQNAQYLIDNITQTQHLKNQTVELLGSWKTDAFQNFSLISGNLNKLKTTFDTAHSLYNSIGELQNGILGLESKRSAIAALHQSQGCTATYYKPICDMLWYLIQTQKNIFTIAANNINTKIDQIAQYSGSNEEGTISLSTPLVTISQQFTSTS